MFLKEQQVGKIFFVQWYGMPNENDEKWQKEIYVFECVFGFWFYLKIT